MDEFKNLEPKGFQMNEVKINIGQKEFEPITNKLPITDFTELLIFLFALGELYLHVMEDEKVTIGDIQHMPELIRLIPKFNAAFEGIKNIGGQVVDEITEQELQELKTAVKNAKLPEKWLAKIDISLDIAKKLNELFQ